MMRLLRAAPRLPASPKIPDGLDRARPRDVRLTGSGRALAALAIALAASSVPAFVGLEVRARADAERLALLRAQGRPVPMVTHRREGGRTRRRPWRPMPPAVPYAVGFALLATSTVPILVLRHQRRLLAEGRPARAVVRSVSKAAQPHGAHHVHYEFRTLGGKVERGTLLRTGAHPAVGDAMWVLYVPDEPRRRRPYPFPLVEPVEKRPLRG